MMYQFKVGEGYDIPSKRGGSVALECVARTEKTVTFEYCCDGERVTKRIFTKSFNLKDDTECVKFDDVIVTA